MLKSKNIFLIGPMGAGKTTVGKLLAKKLAYDFYDTDKEIEKNTGAQVSWIFDLEGEAGFRKRETTVLEQLTKRNPVVLATGGGIILEQKNRMLLTGQGKVVYLAVSIEEQIKRIGQSKDRPLLTQDKVEETLVNLAKKRQALYEEVADITIETTHKSPARIVSEILEALNA